MVPFWWPFTWQDIKLPKEVAAHNPQSSQKTKKNVLKHHIYVKNSLRTCKLMLETNELRVMYLLPKKEVVY